MVTTDGERTLTEANDIKRLRELGLSEYAARAYVAALKLGRADAKSISTLARVPPSKVYEVLGVLEEEGLLQVFPEFPKKYGAVSLEGYLDRLHDEHKNMAQKIASQRAELLAAFRPLEAAVNAEQGDVMVLRGSDRIGDQVRGMIESAERSWLGVGVLGAASRYAEFMEDVRDAKHRGVALRMLLPASEATLPAAQELRRYAEVRVKTALEDDAAREVAIAIADGERAMIVHWRGTDAAPGANDVAIATDERAMASALHALVEMMWASGKPLG